VGSCWSSCWKSVNCGFWRTSGRLRGTLGVDSWYLGFSSLFWVDPVLFGALFDVFSDLRCVLVGFLLFTMVKKCKLWVLENIRKVYGDFWGGSMAFGVFFRFWV